MTVISDRYYQLCSIF